MIADLKPHPAMKETEGLLGEIVGSEPDFTAPAFNMRRWAAPY